MISEGCSGVSSYLSVLLGALDHVYVHVVHQVGHLRHVLDRLVGLGRTRLSLEGEMVYRLFLPSVLFKWISLDHLLLMRLRCE